MCWRVVGVVMLLSNVIKDSSGYKWARFELLDIGEKPNQEITEEITEEKTKPADPMEELENNAAQKEVERLRSELEQRLVELKATAKKVEDEARKKGYLDGYAEGKAAAESEKQDVIRRLDTLVGKLGNISERVLGDYRRWLIDASLVLAKHLVQNELSVDPRWFSDLVEEALKEVRAKHAISIYLDPDDLELLKSHSQLINRMVSEKRIVLHGDKQLGRGGFRIETDFQMLDYTLDTRLDLLKETLQGGKFDPA